GGAPSTSSWPRTAHCWFPTTRRAPSIASITRGRRVKRARIKLRRGASLRPSTRPFPEALLHRRAARHRNGLDHAVQGAAAARRRLLPGPADPLQPQAPLGRRRYRLPLLPHLGGKEFLRRDSIDRDLHELPCPA